VKVTGEFTRNKLSYALGVTNRFSGLFGGNVAPVLNVTHLDGIGVQHIGGFNQFSEGRVMADTGGQQRLQVVSLLHVEVHVDEHCLEHLLGALLGMETYGVSDLRVRRERVAGSEQVVLSTGEPTPDGGPLRFIHSRPRPVP